MNLSDWTIGIDLGDRKSVCFAMDQGSGEVREGSFTMTEQGLRSYLEPFGTGLLVFEAGGQSRWVKRVAEELGFTVRVADPRHLALITRSARKNDRNDAYKLAQLATSPLELINRVTHRDDRRQADLSIAKAREALVSARTQLVNMSRGMVKSTGARLKSCDAGSFHRLRDDIPSELQSALGPVFDQIESLTKQIRAYERTIEEVCAERYQETALLRKIRGVGPLTAFVFVLTLGSHERFARSRSVGAYFGLCPRQHESGALRKELGITKAGDALTRKLLVQAAHYILGPFGEDCDLRRWGERLNARGGKAAKKRAAVAVARKLAVLLHRLWADGSEYEKLRKHTQAA